MAETLAEAQKHGSEFIKLASYEELRSSFVDNPPETGALVAGLGSTAFNVECNAVFVAKSLLEADSKPKKRNSPPGIETNAQKAAKTKFVAERLTRGWYAMGEWVKAWKPNMRIGTSPREQFDYCNGREQEGGNWNIQESCTVA